MGKRILTYIAIYILCMFAGTTTGTLICNDSSGYYLGTVLFSPLCLLIRIFGLFYFLIPDSGMPIYTTPTLFVIDWISLILVIISSVFYFRKRKYIWSIVFGVSFAVLNIGNIDYFLLMMSV
jgi:hypothetical protein